MLTRARICQLLPCHHHRCHALSAGVIETGSEAELAAQLKQETPEETAARLARESSAAKDSIRCPLHSLLIAGTRFEILVMCNELLRG